MLFYNALSNGNIEEVKEYAENGADINILKVKRLGENEINPLKEAMILNNTIMVKNLLEIGADVDYVDKHGMSLLRCGSDNS